MRGYQDHLNVYGDVVTDEMQQAHSKVVGLALNRARGDLSSVGHVNGNRRQISLGNTQAGIDFRRTVPFPKVLRRMGCVRPQSLAATVFGGDYECF
jgi:hypothetical protein